VTTQGSVKAVKPDVLVVGAGFAGSVVAREAADAGYCVEVIDRRPHIAGNAYDSTDAHGVMVHDYGPHIFHTNSDRIVRWLSRFTNWRFYEHRVLAKVGDQLVPIPINRTTINHLYGLDLDEKGAAEFLEARREPRDRNVTSEDVVLSSVGSDLCDKFFRGYTRKQWGLDLSELSAGVAARIPTRTNDDDRYFTDTYQLMPLDGYTAMFRAMLDHPNITVHTGVDFAEYRRNVTVRKIVYTGPIDEYFDFRFGRLPYRSLRFDHEHLPDREQVQAVGTVNYPNDHDYTRVTEFKHLTGQAVSGTSVVREFPQAEGDPYYPIPRPENEALFKRYQELTESEVNTYFVGRLAQYRYYNMDQVVGAALSAAQDLIRDLAHATAAPDVQS
jgi:UDP-galactopyranose mutase